MRASSHLQERPASPRTGRSLTAGTPAVEGGRIEAVDILRGFVMALMALDHTRDFFGGSGFNPRDVSEPALFLTRWITHFCAPTFIFLAGLSAYLYGRGRSLGDTSRFIFTRGLWLIFTEFTLVSFAWSFDARSLAQPFGGVIWVIGASMIVLAALIYLPRWAIGAFAIILIAGHNLFDGVKAEDLGAAGPLWHVLHEPGRIALGDSFSVFILYTLIPWVGVIAAGYALGPVMQLEPHTRKRILLRLGAAITLGFILLRAINLYGDPAPWAEQGTWLATALSFLNCEKYPPSLLYLMMTLGPALMLLAAFDHAHGRLADWLAVFGRVPFFFYVVHLYLIHALALATSSALTGALPEGDDGVGLGLGAVYLVWLLVLVLLYPICRWFAEMREGHSEWWWRYL
jgi:uncharacterized membrane protein